MIKSDKGYHFDRESGMNVKRALYFPARVSFFHSRVIGACLSCDRGLEYGHE